MKRLSVVPGLAQMQESAGPGLCCICLRALKRGRGKVPVSVACWSADCQTEVSIIRGQFRRRRLAESLRCLSRVVAALGWSTKVLSMTSKRRRCE